MTGIAETDLQILFACQSIFLESPNLHNVCLHNTHDYDIVYGPVADDSVYTQFTLYEGGIISMPTLIQELKTYKLVDQYLFHTKKSLQAIKFVESKIIKI